MLGCALAARPLDGRCGSVTGVAVDDELAVLGTPCPCSNILCYLMLQMIITLLYFYQSVFGPTWAWSWRLNMLRCGSSTRCCCALAETYGDSARRPGCSTRCGPIVALLSRSASAPK